MKSTKCKGGQHEFVENQKYRCKGGVIIYHKSTDTYTHEDCTCDCHKKEAKK